MMARPIFLRGMRRLLVRLDVNAFEAAVLVLFCVVAVLFFARHVGAAPDIACDAPTEHQVLVWTWRDDGAASCQYVERAR